MSLAVDDRYTRPLYSWNEAARIAHLSAATLRRWVNGYSYRARDGRIVWRDAVIAHQHSPDGASFHDLIEGAIVARLRAKKLTLTDIARAVTYLREQLGEPRPLVSEALKLRVGGGELFWDPGKGQHPIEVARIPGRLVFRNVLEPFLQDVAYEDELVARWWPAGRSAHVVIDPTRGFGRPIVEGRGVRTDILFEQFEIGESIADIADDFHITEDDVRYAIAYERAQRSA